MPIQSLPDFADSPDGIGGALCSQMESSRASRAMKRRAMLNQKTLQESFLLPAEGAVTFDCMFCEESYKQHDDLGKHVMTRHRPTLCEPTVLRIDAEYLSPQDKHRKSAGSLAEDIGDDHDGPDCSVCGQTFLDSSDLEIHMKKHKDSFTYSCDICGRRFKEPWFLKNHKKTHSSRAGVKNKLQQAPDDPITINEVVQEEVSQNLTMAYKLCMVCGFYFPDRKTLLEHSKIHLKGAETAAKSKTSAPCKENANRDGGGPKPEFLNFLKLKPKSLAVSNTQTTRKWIGELDPFNTYQAWQLATKGKVALGLGRLKEPQAECNMETDLSDKDEVAELWNTAKMNQDETETIKSEDGDGGAASQVPEAEKLSNEPEKSTLCIDCGKLFKTYHQLVLHSRVHRKDRSDSESSASYEGLIIAESPGSQAGPEDNEVNKIEEVSEAETGDSAANERNEDDQAEVKMKSYLPSRQCSYCRKSFRSNYYLNIHLRTHTGEKPYKCDFCDYAAAQKTSLRYHLERHHKFKPGESNARVKSISRNLQLLKKSSEVPHPAAPKSESRQSPLTIDGAKEDPLMSKPPKRMSALRNKLIYAKQGFKNEKMALENDGGRPLREESIGATPCHSVSSPSLPEEISLSCVETLDDEPCANEEQSNELPLDEADVQEDSAPLNLSKRRVEELSAKFYNNAVVSIRTCPYCTYKTLYPEVLSMHQRLVHKQHLHKNGMRNRNPALLLKMRRTGCPPALQGVDVSPQQLDSIRPKAPPLHLKTEKPKRPSAQPNKMANSANVGQENEPQPVQHNGQTAGGYRYMQPDLQSMSHLLERMQQPEQRRPQWSTPPSAQKTNMIVSAERPYPMVPIWPAGHPFVRPAATHPELGEPLGKRTKHNIPNLAPTTYLNTDLVQRLHPSQATVTSQEVPSTKPLNPQPPANVPHHHEVDQRWNSYQHPPPAGPTYRAPNAPHNQESTSAQEARNPPPYRWLSKGDFGPNEKST